MNSKITHAAAFLTGMAAGGAAVWQYAMRKYERIAEKEIASVKETYSRRESVVIPAGADGETAEEPKTEAKTPAPREGVVEYAARLRREGYLPNENGNKTGPYIISPEEFGEMDGYSKISLTYYSDGTLTEGDEVVESPDEIVGSDFPNHFGEYEDDSVFVRNDERKSDYEILFDQRSYSEIPKLETYR